MVTKTHFYQAAIANLVQQTPCIRSIQLSIPVDYPRFQPGHVIHLQVEALPGIDQPYPTKTYCICSLPEDGMIELCVDLVNERGVSGFLHHQGQGAMLTISNPKGHFILQESATSPAPLIFLGIGSGVGVIRGMMRQHYRHSMSRQPVHLYAINTDETSIPYEQDLEDAVDRYPTLEVYPILQTNGYDVDEIIDRMVGHTDDPGRWILYGAGPAEPLETLQSGLALAGFVPKQFHLEKYR